MPEVHLKSVSVAVLHHLNSSDLLESEDRAMVAAVAEAVTRGVNVAAVEDALDGRILAIAKGITMTKKMSKAEAELMVQAARLAVEADRKRGVDPNPRMIEISKLQLDADQRTAAATR